jgi:uncharacterized protein DUF3891
MIRQTRGEHFLLITQMEHARLAASLAAQFGNPRFAAPLPRAPVLQAVELHDAGWPLHDDAPTLNPAGLPTDVFEMPLETDLAIWSKSTDLAGPNPYARLLISLHGLSLSMRSVIHTPAQKFGLIKFQHQQIEIQENLRRAIGLPTDQPLRHGLAELGRSPEEDLVLFNFHLLQFADQLSLNLCLGQVRLPAIDHFSPRPGESAVTLRFSRAKSGEYSVDPWPFEVDMLPVPIQARRIPARTYKGPSDLHAELNQAPQETLSLLIRSAALPA